MPEIAKNYYADLEVMSMYRGLGINSTVGHYQSSQTGMYNIPNTCSAILELDTPRKVLHPYFLKGVAMPVIAKFKDIEVEVLSVNKELGVSAVKAVNCEPWPTYTLGGWAFTRYNNVATTSLSDIRIEGDENGG